MVRYSVQKRKRIQCYPKNVLRTEHALSHPAFQSPPRIPPPPLTPTSGVTDDEFLAVFFTMLNDGSRSFIHIFTALKERFVQLPQYIDITLVGLAQYSTHGINRLLSNHRDNCGVDCIIHDRLPCSVCLLKRWHPSSNPGNTHGCHDFPACQMGNDLVRSGSNLISL